VGQERREREQSTELESLEFGSYQGRSGYDGCGIVVIYSVVNCKTEGSPERLSCTWL
jgi:hypothetical protein